MNLDLVLRRPLVVRRFDLVASLAREVRRSELAPVLLWATEQEGSSRGLDPAALATALLGPGTGMVTVARRLLVICRELGLVGEDGVVTDSGRHAAKTGLVMQPEQAEWTIWASDDELLPFPVLAVALKSASGTNGGAGTKRLDHRSNQPGALPDWLHRIQGQAAEVVVDGRSSTVRFDDISAPALESATEGSAEVRWTVSQKSKLQVVGSMKDAGKLDRAPERSDLPPFNEVWAEMLACEGLLDVWDSARAALRVPFSEATDAERASMVRELAFNEPRLGHWGAFQTTKVPGVRVCPCSDRDAAAWARHHLESRITTVQTSTSYPALVETVRLAFQEWSVELPTREELARDLARGAGGVRSRASWAVQAGLDWKL